MATERAQRRSILRRRWTQQHRLCVWCGRWTWCASVITLGDARRRLGLPPYGDLTERQRRLLLGTMATCEHVRPRAMGGLDNRSNLVSACHDCNNVRQHHASRLDAHPHVFGLLPRHVQAVMWEVLGAERGVPQTEPQGPIDPARIAAQ